jgi:hypothetical protein
MLLPFLRKRRFARGRELVEADDRRVVALINEARTPEDLNLAIKLARMRRAA